MDALQSFALFCWHRTSLMAWTLTSTYVQYARFVLLLISPAFSAPASFPKTGNGLWYSQPGDVWANGWLPVGNGYLGGMSLMLLYHNYPNAFPASIPGGTFQETTQLNIESLWSGGPFADPVCNDTLRLGYL